eukprot:scaffold40062_cov42-Tisochrysis_lutea.AAC.2
MARLAWNRLVCTAIHSTALWGKCNEAFMRGHCTRSCGLCESKRHQPVILLSARQAAPCNTSQGEIWVNQARANKQAFAALWGWQMVWSSELVDPSFVGSWNKLTVLRKLLRDELAASSNGSAGGWILWMDWDVMVTDPEFRLPLVEYEERHVWLVLGGDPKHILVASPDYLRANTGLMLLRVHKWSLALVERMLSKGAPHVKRKNALEAQESVRNLCYGCFDDQAALLVLLREQPERWRPHIQLERRFHIQSYWEDIEGAFPRQAKSVTSSTKWPARRIPGWPSEARLLRPVHGHWPVPFAVHFAGCQLCSGKLTDADRLRRCVRTFESVARYAQSTKPMTV